MRSGSGLHLPLFQQGFPMLGLEGIGSVARLCVSAGKREMKSRVHGSHRSAIG
jgi:hypothetical protein